MADIPVNRVANNLVITKESGNKYIGLWIPTITAQEQTAVPIGDVHFSVPIHVVVNAPQNPTNGYYSILNLFRTFGTHAPVYERIVTCDATPTGVGLTIGSPYTLPRGPRLSVEVLGNQVIGFEYIDSTPGNNNVKRIYNGQGGTGWQSVQTV